MAEPIVLEWHFPKAIETRWVLPPAKRDPVAAYIGQRGLSAAQQLFDAGTIPEPTPAALAAYLEASEAAGEAALEAALEAIETANADALEASQAAVVASTASAAALLAAQGVSVGSIPLRASKAEGDADAALLEDAWFQVIGDQALTSMILYRKDSATTSVQVASYPAAEFVNAIGERFRPSVSSAVAPGLAFVASSISKPWIKRLLGQFNLDDGALEINRLRFTKRTPTGNRWLMATVTAADQILFGIDKRGRVRALLDEASLAYASVNSPGGPVAEADLPAIGGVPATSGIRGASVNVYASDAYGPPLQFRRPAAGGTLIVKSARRAEIATGNGQSLGVGGGATSGVGVTTACPSPELIFTLDDSKGTRGDVGSAASVGGAGLKPSVEFYNGGDLGETPWTAMTAAQQALRMADGLPVVPVAYRNHGQGGTALSGIESGTTNYANGLAYVTRFRDLFIAEGYPASIVRGVDFVHGEQDRSVSTSYSDYYDGLAALIADYNTDYPAITDQTEPVYLFVSQLSASTTTDVVGDIGQAQLDLCLTDPLAVYTAPRYILPHEYDEGAETYDRLHLSPVGSRLLGEYQAKARHAVEKTGTKWLPCHLIPGAFTLTGSTLRWRCHVPRGPLRINRDLLALHPSLGFGFGDNGGAIALSGSVTIENGDTLVFPLASTPGAGRYISAGFDTLATANPGYATAWTNISDSDPTPSRTIPGLKLANYLASTRMTY